MYVCVCVSVLYMFIYVWQCPKSVSEMDTSRSSSYICSGQIVHTVNWCQFVEGTKLSRKSKLNSILKERFCSPGSIFEQYEQKWKILLLQWLENDPRFFLVTLDENLTEYKPIQVNFSSSCKRSFIGELKSGDNYVNSLMTEDAITQKPVH